jgi:IclR family KDG regulon transcriptional repressor
LYEGGVRLLQRDGIHSSGGWKALETLTEVVQEVKNFAIGKKLDKADELVLTYSKCVMSSLIVNNLTAVDENRKLYFQISSLEKGLKFLELLAEKEALSVTKAAQHLGFNRTNSHRYLATLRKLGYVEQDGEARYHLTFKILELGGRFLSRFEIRWIARPYLQQLSLLFNETIILGFWEGHAIRILDKIDSPNVLRTDPTLGTLMPAHCTSSGKAILAHLPQKELNAFLTASNLRAYSLRTITKREALAKELVKTKNRGFAIDNEEFLPGIKCVGAPVFDYAGRPAYSVSVAGPSFRMNKETVDRVQRKVREVCGKISAALGTVMQVRN